MEYLQESETEYTIRLDRDDNIIKCLELFAEEKEIKSGRLTGIGAVKDIELGIYHLSKQEYNKKIFPNDSELLSLSGNVTIMEDRPFFHLHAVLCDEKFQCFGGHLFNGSVAGTLEIKLIITNQTIYRKRDLKTNTGLNLISFD